MVSSGFERWRVNHLKCRVYRPTPPERSGTRFRSAPCAPVAILTRDFETTSRYVVPPRRVGTGMIVAVEQTAEAPESPHDRQDVPRTIAYDEFGAAFLRRVLHLQRVVESIDRILGPTIELGPIGAGPGRKIARLTASGQFLPSRGEVIPGPEVAYRVFVPLTITFDIDLRVDTHRFHADIVIP